MSEPETALYKAAVAAAQAKGLRSKTVSRLVGWIKVPKGYYLCAADCGGIGSPSGAHATALRTDATHPGKGGIFTIEVPPAAPAKPTPGKLPSPLSFEFALRTPAGRYVTAVNGGGIGKDPDAPDVPQPIVTNAATDAVILGTLFILEERPDGKVTISTEDGHYVTANNGAKSGGSKRGPIQTTATSVGKNERFTFEPKLTESVTQNGPGKH